MGSFGFERRVVEADNNSLPRVACGVDHCPAPVILSSLLSYTLNPMQSRGREDAEYAVQVPTTSECIPDQEHAELTSLSSYGSRDLPGCSAHVVAVAKVDDGGFLSSALFSGSDEDEIAETNAPFLSPRSSAYLRGLEETLARGASSFSLEARTAISPVVSLPPRRGLSIGYDQADGSPLAPTHGSAGYYVKEATRDDDLRPAHLASALQRELRGLQADAVQRRMAMDPCDELGVPLPMPVVRSKRKGHAMPSFATRAQQTRAAVVQRERRTAQRDKAVVRGDLSGSGSGGDEGAKGAAREALREGEGGGDQAAPPPSASSASAAPPHPAPPPPPQPPHQQPAYELSGPAWNSYSGSSRPKTAGSLSRAYVVANRRAGAKVGAHTGAHKAIDVGSASPDVGLSPADSVAYVDAAAPDAALPGAEPLMMDGLLKSPPFRAHAGEY